MRTPAAPTAGRAPSGRFAAALVVNLARAGSLAAACSSAPAAPAPTPSGPAAARVADAVDAFLASAPDSSQVRAILVEQDGRKVFERYYHATADEYRNVASVTKPIVFTLVGTALADGHLRSLDQPLSELLPDRAAVMSPEVAGTTLRQLLTMTTGFAGTREPLELTDFLSTADPVEFILTHPVRSPGREFEYSDGNAQLVAAILERAVGGSLLDYARTALFDPLGVPTRPAFEPRFVPDDLAPYEAAGFTWPVDAAGDHLGFAYLKLRPCDLLRIGELYLDEGVWKGDRILPAEWVDEATMRQVDTPGVPKSGYGFGWWMESADGAPAYAAEGFGGQLVEVVPERRLVVVASTEFDLADYANHRMTEERIIELVDTQIAPALRGAASPDAGSSSPGRSRHDTSSGAAPDTGSAR